MSEIFGNKKTTERGFSLVEFKDSNGVECSLQQSSAIGCNGGCDPGQSFVWLGVNDADPQIMRTQARSLGMDLPPGEVCGWMRYEIPNSVLMTTRMHLDRSQVRNLINMLERWLTSGRFDDGSPCGKRVQP